MSDFNSQNINAAAERGAVGVMAATKNMQAFAAEFAEMSRESLEHTSETIEKLRNARGVSEMMAIQQTYIREAFEHLSQHARKFSELMTHVPLELTKTYADAWSKTMKSTIKTTEEAGEKAVENVERFAQRHS